MLILFLSVVIILIRNRTQNQSRGRSKEEPRSRVKNKSKEQNNNDIEKQVQNEIKTNETKDENIVDKANESINVNDTEIKRESRIGRRRRLMKLKFRNKKSSDKE